MASGSLSALPDPGLTGSQGVAAEAESTPQARQRAKSYTRTKLIASLSSAVLSFIVLLLFVWLGFSRDFAAASGRVTSNPYLALVIFAALTGLVLTAVSVPFGFYSGYYVEHKYHLSNQTFGQWVWERLKGTLVSVPLGGAVLLILYACLQEYGNRWWLPVSIVMTVLSVLLARLAPVLIMPLFYKFTPVEGALKERILELCGRAGVRVVGVFSFNLSKNTRKANAGFTGIGRSRRIILGDTLLREFSDEEIETVFAHELGHYRLRHIRTGIVVGTILTFAGLYVLSLLYGLAVQIFGFQSITDLGALPLLGLLGSLIGLVTAPLGNMLSRRHERLADAYAVRTTGNTGAFIRALRKLAAMNLADREPHPLVEFLFYSHPSINRRIRMLEVPGS